MMRKLGATIHLPKKDKGVPMANFQLIQIANRRIWNTRAQLSKQWITEVFTDGGGSDENSKQNLNLQTRVYQLRRQERLISMCFAYPLQ